MLNLAEAPVRLIAERFAPLPPSDTSPEPQMLTLTERIATLQKQRTKRGERTMLSLSEGTVTDSYESQATERGFRPPMAQNTWP